MAGSRWCGILIAGALLTGCASAGVAPGERGIVVNGTGRVAAAPDAAVVSLGVQAGAPRLDDATAEVDRTMRAVLARVKAAGVDDGDIRTIIYAIDPLAEPRPPGGASPRIVGYRVSNIVQVRTRAVQGLGRIVDAAVAAGANVVRDLRYTLEDSAAAEAQARTLAMQDAATRARQLAAAAGVRLGRLLSVTESSPVSPMGRVSLATAPGPIEAGQLEVTVGLEARYALEP